MAKSFVTKLAGDANPIPVFKFWIEINGIVEAEFKECSGLRLERRVEEVEEGGVNDYVHILPGRNRYSNIVLKYGTVLSTSVWDWYQEGLYDGKVTRKDFSILLRGIDGQVVKTWNVVKGFPVKWEGPTLNSEASQAAIETLEIAHHGLTLAK